MVSGKGDIPNIGGPKPQNVTRIDIKKAQEKELAPQKSTANFDKTVKDNKSVFSKPSASQDSLAANKTGTDTNVKHNQSQDRKGENIKQESKQTDAGLKKDYEVPNVTLNAFLKTRKANRRSKNAKSKKNKKSAPKMNLKTRLSPKGAINPRRSMPAVPGRLGSLKPMDPKAQLQEAVNFIESQPAYQDPNLIAQYAKQLLEQGIDSKENKSFASLLGLDESIADLDKEAIKSLITDKMNNADLSDELKALLSDVLTLLNQPEANALKPLVLLFLPFPFPYMLMDEDEDFWVDDDELFEDEELADEDSEDQDEDEERGNMTAGEAQVFQEDFEVDVEASMAISTLNYGKIHLNITHDDKRNKFKLSVKGDEVAEDLAIVLESSLDLALSDAEIWQDQMKRWHDNVLRITESRSLQMHSTGHLNENFLRACSSILNTICENDDPPESTDGGMIDANYEVLD